LAPGGGRRHAHRATVRETPEATSERQGTATKPVHGALPMAHRRIDHRFEISEVVIQPTGFC
jgi:hypothetical protein